MSNNKIPALSSKIDKTDLISIIIPIYNSEMYIHRILDSIFNQTYLNFEIIFAYDEKTTDDSLKLLQIYADKYPNILIDISLDIGPGCARNRGLKRASGDFVVFVDADDILHPCYLKYLHNIFVQYPELDVGFCNFLKINQNIPNPSKHVIVPLSNVILYERNEILNHYINRSLINTRAAWPYMVRRKYLLDNNIHFSEERYAEDQYWVFHVLCNSPFIGYISNKLYYYIQCPGSICHTIDWKAQFNGVQFVITEITPLLSKIDSELTDIYYSHYTYELFLLLARNNSYQSLNTYLSKEEYEYLNACFRRVGQQSVDKKIFCKSLYVWYIIYYVYTRLPNKLKRLLTK